MHKTQAKIQSMSTAEWHQYHQLLESRRLIDYFADEILRFAHSQLKPDDVLRRFSLNGDGQLDLKEFQLAVKRLGIVQSGGAASRAAAPDDAAAQRKSKELFSAFCPSNNKKLEIDMFCRIMAEWSLQLMRAQHGSGHQQQQRQSWPETAPIPTPYAIEHASQSSDSITMGSSGGGGSRAGLAGSEGETIWRRIRDAVVQSLDKLSQIFFRMDIASCGCLSQEEFALAMGHIGVFLTPREYEKLYEALPMELKNLEASSSDASFSIRYAEFLAAVQHRHPEASKHAPSVSAGSTSSPPIATHARLWDTLVLELDTLEPLIVQYERARQRYVAADTFRDLLLRCGIALSNPDFAALRVRLLPFSDANGSIGLSPLLHALKAHDHTARATSVRSSTIASGPPSSLPGCGGAVTVSPIRTGRKTVFPSVTELLQSTPFATIHTNSNSSSSSSNGGSAAATHAAGKSNEQRNHEANRSIIKIRDESRWNSNINFHAPPGAGDGANARRLSDHNGDDDEAGGGPAAARPLALERRILTKLQQLKDVGQLGSASPQSVFPGDRFGRITRGQLRQSLVHLGLVARYAEVEGLFWTLDPSGRGFLASQDLYDHLNASAAKLAALAQPPCSHSSGHWSLPALSPTGSGSGSALLTRPVQKIFEGMLLQWPALLAICQRYDVHQCGLVSRGELTAAIHELGVLASPQDVATAILAITQRVELLPPNAPSAPPPHAEPFHPNGIVYAKLEARLQQLCSDLLSPKKRRQHLSTASVLLAPQETQAFGATTTDGEFSLNVASETDALWNCPRRKMNQDHRAMKSSIQIADQVFSDATPRPLDSPTGSDRAAAGTASLDRVRSMPRGRRLTVIAILQDLLERRGELKSIVDLHRHADVHGQVTRADLVEILMASRLNLNFSTAVPAGITAREFVDVLYPHAEAPRTVGFLELLHRVSDLLSELTRVTPLGATSATGLYSNNAYPRETAKRIHTAAAGSSAKTGVSFLPILADPLSGRSPRSAAASANSGDARRTLSLFASDELSLQRKLLYESRLRELLLTDKGRQSAAILIRHAFKGVMARELVVPIDNGEFEAVCRTSDLRHVCLRLGLDLDVGELHFVVASIDVSQSGYVASPQLLQFFSHLAMRAASGHTNEPSGGGSGQFAAASPREETRRGRSAAALY